MTQTATVFGGGGFLGREVTALLQAQGVAVRVATRQNAPLDDAAALRRIIDGADIVINLIGILAEARPGEFMRVQGEAPGVLARLASESGAGRFVHVSAIGAQADSPSLYARSKAAGEAAVLAAFPQAVILRPSIIFGPGDSFFNRFAAMARFMPVLPITGGAVRFQPVYVQDVAQAVLSAPPGLYELGGPDIMGFAALLRLMFTYTHQHRLIWDMPVPVALLQAAVLERLPGKLLTRDQVRLLASDNVVNPQLPGFAALGIAPHPMGDILPRYLSRAHASV
jgi:NADH dehydrogenase